MALLVEPAPNGNKSMMRIVVLIFVFLSALQVNAERLKDIATIEGVRSNQLIGYGLVVGLDGTGDQTNQTPRHYASRGC